MTTIQTIHQYRCDLNQGPNEVTLKTPIMHQDSLGDVFRVAVWRGNKVVDLTGMTVRGFLYFASTRQTLLLEGSITDGCACVTLTSECYAIPGYASLVVQVQDGDVRHSVLKVNMCITRTGSEIVIDPGDILPTLPELLGQIAAMEQATAEAREAAAAADAAREGIKGDLAALAEGVGDASAINDGAITPLKTSFFDVVEVNSINLLDISKVSAGTYLNLSGGLNNNASYNTTDYLPVKPGDVLRYQAALEANSSRFDFETSPGYGVMRFAALYDENRIFIADTLMQSVGTVRVNVDNARYCRITLSVRMTSAYEPMIFSAESPSIVPYEPFFEPYAQHKIKKEYTYMDEVTAFLPHEICIANGRTIEMYNKQILPNAEKYHFKLDAKSGNQVHGRNFGRKSSFEGLHGWAVNKTVAPVGLTIYNDDLEVVWSGNTTLKYAPALSTPKTLCCIGDSLTNNKAWLAEIILLAGGNLSLVGTRQLNTRDSDGNVRTGYHEGRSGWSAASYNQPGAETPDEAAFKYANPFYNASAGHFDWNYYVTNSLGGVSPDAVMLWLGTNGMAIDPTANAEAIKTLVDYIRADDASIPIFLAYTIYPGNQDALGAQTSSDGYAANNGAWAYEEYKMVLNLCVKLTELMGEYENLHFVPLATCHDSEYNYGAVETPVNPRAAQTVKMPIEAVHPQAQGYYQIADVVFSSLSVHLGE